MKRQDSPVLSLMLVIALVGLVASVSDPSITGLFHKENPDFADLVCNKRGLCPTSFAGATPFGCVETGPVKIADSCVPAPIPDPGATACYDYPGGTGTTVHACSSSSVTYVCDNTGFYEIKKSSCLGNTGCSDSDGGVVVSEKGIVTAPSRLLPFVGAYIASAATAYKDHCVGDGGVAVETSSILREYYCTGEGVSFVDYDCTADGGYCRDPPGGPDRCTALAQGQTPPPAPCAGVLNPCATSSDCLAGQTCLGCQCFGNIPPPSPFNAIWGYPIVNQECVPGEVMTLYGKSRVCTSGAWEVVNPVPTTDSFFDVFTTVQDQNEAQTLAEATIAPAVAPVAPSVTSRCPDNTQCAGIVPGSTESFSYCTNLFRTSPDLQSQPTVISGVALGCNAQCQCAPTQPPQG
ncbi:hypothetical protein HY492_03120 [Candidatus Woesearchaeota archaeon]|nr:hypothetical protein [Candidatus Woesearchaeota archaeon]